MNKLHKHTLSNKLYEAAEAAIKEAAGAKTNE